MGRYWCAALLALGACRGASGDGFPNVVGDEFGSTAGTATEPSSGIAAGGAGEPQDELRAAPSDRSPPVTTEGGSTSSTQGCGAEPVTLDEIHSGRVRPKVPIQVSPLVASSQKFLVSEAKSGSCLWGAFAAEPARSGAGSGLFLVSFGPPHADAASCESGSDGLPDDLKPGDSLEVEGVLDAYVPASCDGTAPAQQLRVDAACPARRGPAVAPPEAAVVDRTLADRLAAGTDAQLMRDWSGALLRLEDVSALPDPDDGDAVFAFGVVRLEQTALEVHSRLYYFDLSEGGPRASVKAPHYRYPTAFQSISGVVFLDYCSWVLAPRDRCADLAPQSEGCAVQAARP